LYDENCNNEYSTLINLLLSENKSKTIDERDKFKKELNEAFSKLELKLITK